MYVCYVQIYIVSRCVLGAVVCCEQMCARVLCQVCKRLPLRVSPGPRCLQCDLVQPLSSSCVLGLSSSLEANVSSANLPEWGSPHLKETPGPS